MEFEMMNRWRSRFAAALALTALAGCADITAREGNTAVGAAVGGGHIGPRIKRWCPQNAWSQRTDRRMAELMSPTML